MKVLYFSSTGNCLYIARQIGGELLSIPKVIKEKTYTVQNNYYKFEDDIIGIVIPVYWLSVPAYIRDFLSHASFNCDYLFGIMTYGGSMFGALNDLNTIRMAGTKRFDYLNAVKMTENYLPMYEMEKEIRKAESYNIENNIAKICGDIRSQVHYIPKIGWFDRLLTKKYAKKHCFAIGKGEAAGMYVTDACSFCGQCVRICPMQNIQLQDKKVNFGIRCADCLSCVHNCPGNAIHMKKEKSSKRYRNPNITVQEIVYGNINAPK